MTKHAKIWARLRKEAAILKKKEPVLAAFVEELILSRKNLAEALTQLLAHRLCTKDVNLRPVIAEAHKASPALADAAARDLECILRNDPAAHDVVTPFLFFKGFHALQAYRVAHMLWKKKRTHLACHIQNRASDLFGVDIHPAAKIGTGVMMDHATGIVVGETAVVEDDVLFWHGVTLGGIGLSGGNRHPKIRRGVMLGAGSTVLGNIEVGPGARVAAGSVVIKKVPADVTVAGVPAKIVG